MSIRKTIFDLEPSPVGEAEATDEMEVYRAPQSKSFKRKVGEAAAYDVGTGAGELPTNADLGSASLVDVGTGAAEVPTNGDLTPAAGDVQIWETSYGSELRSTTETDYLDWRDLEYDNNRSIFVSVIKAGVIRATIGSMRVATGAEGEGRILKNGVAQVTQPFSATSSATADITVAVGDRITFQLKSTNDLAVFWSLVRVFADKAIGAVV